MYETLAEVDLRTNPAIKDTQSSSSIGPESEPTISAAASARAVVEDEIDLDTKFEAVLAAHAKRLPSTESIIRVVEEARRHDS